MKASRMTWISHAATIALRRRSFPNDETIDDKGLKAARSLSAALVGADKIWTSPELRTRQTAEALGLLARTAPELRDCDFGRWVGLSFDAVATEEPDAVENWLRNPAAAPHGGESLHTFVGRIAEWLDEQAAETGHTIVVTHPAVIRAALLHALEASEQTFWRIDISPLSRTVLTRTQGAWRVRAIVPAGSDPSVDVDPPALA